MQCRDPLDQKFLELAVAAGAALLITKDRDLLKLRKRARAHGVSVVAPAAFVPVAPATSLESSALGPGPLSMDP
jgi:predicted nucleic acid-binding protein